MTGLCLVSGCDETPDDTTPTDTDTVVVQPDEDGDGVATEDDCDDTDPLVWSTEVFEGELANPIEIDTFCQGYCSRNIDGDLKITTGSVPEGLLSCVTEVTGDYAVRGEVTDIEGLATIKTVGGSLYIERLRNLDNTFGIEVETVGGDVVIADNAFLDRASVFRTITTIGGDLRVERNESLIALAGRSLTSIGGALVLDDNNDLSVLTALNTVTSVGGDLTVKGNPKLVLFTENGSNDLNSLTTLDGGLTLDVDLGTGALPNLTEADFLVYGGNNEQTLDGLNGLQTITGDLTINMGENTILSMGGLTALTRIDGDMLIDEVTVERNEVHSINGLGNLQSIGGSVRLTSQGITNTNFMRSVNGVGADVVISDCTQLEGITGFNGITTLDGNLDITSNDILDSVVGFRNLKNVNGEVRIKGNRKLTSREGLRSLFYVEGDLEITSNWRQLVTLEGLASLVWVDGDLNLAYNYELNDITALRNLNQVSGDICIYTNPSLEQAAVDFLLGNIKTIGGQIDTDETLGICDP